MPLGLGRPAGAVALLERRLRRSSGGATDPLRAADGARDRATEAARDRATDAARDRATDAARDRPPIEERREPLEGDSSTIGCRTSRSSCALALCFFFSSGLSTSRGTARRRVALNSDDAEAGRWSTYPRGDVVECCTGQQHHAQQCTLSAVQHNAAVQPRRPQHVHPVVGTHGAATVRGLGIGCTAAGSAALTQPHTQQCTHHTRTTDVRHSTAAPNTGAEPSTHALDSAPAAHTDP